MVEINEKLDYIVNGKELSEFLTELEKMEVNINISSMKFGLFVNVRDTNDSDNDANLMVYHGIDREDSVEVSPEHKEDLRVYFGTINNNKLLRFLGNKPKQYEIVDSSQNGIKKITINHEEKRIYLSN